jgi:hypothetical protein
MAERTRRASGAEQLGDSHRTGSRSAGRPEECDEEDRYINPGLLTRSGFEAFSFDNSTSARDNLSYFGTLSSEEPALSYYNTGHQEAAGSSLGGFPPHPYVTPVSGDPSDAYDSLSTEESFTYYLQAQQTAPVHFETT